MEDSLGLQMRLGLRAMRQAFKHEIAASGVPLGAWYLLRALWREDGLTQRELADRTAALQSNVTVSLRELERMQLVSVAQEASDRRKRRVWLTDKARQLEHTVLPRVERLNEVALQGFSQRDARELSRMLALIHANFDRYLRDRGVAGGNDDEE